jgi:hypothetical protein
MNNFFQNTQTSKFISNLKSEMSNTIIDLENSKNLVQTEKRRLLKSMLKYLVLTHTSSAHISSNGYWSHERPIEDQPVVLTIYILSFLNTRDCLQLFMTCKNFRYFGKMVFNITPFVEIWSTIISDGFDMKDFLNLSEKYQKVVVRSFLMFYKTNYKESNDLIRLVPFISQTEDVNLLKLVIRSCGHRSDFEWWWQSMKNCTKFMFGGSMYSKELMIGIFKYSRAISSRVFYEFKPEYTDSMCEIITEFKSNFQQIFLTQFVASFTGNWIGLIEDEATQRALHIHLVSEIIEHHDTFIKYINLLTKNQLRDIAESIDRAKLSQFLVRTCSLITFNLPTNAIKVFRHLIPIDSLIESIQVTCNKLNNLIISKQRIYVPHLMLLYILISTSPSTRNVSSYIDERLIKFVSITLPKLYRDPITNKSTFIPDFNKRNGSIENNIIYIQSVIHLTSYYE